MTKFYEKNCDMYALKFFMKAYPEVEIEPLINDVYGRLDRHIKSIPYLDPNELYSSNYTYDRLNVNLKLSHAHQIT